MTRPHSPLLQASQRSHIATVMQVADDGLCAPAAQRHDDIIRASWQRCVHQHRLDPTRMQEAVILPERRLREHRDQMEAFLHIARHGLEALHDQVAGMDYVVLLTDAKGVTVDFIGDLASSSDLRKAGLYLGADWSEALAGTCGVGTCLSTGQALTVHLDDHFDATHIPLTCTAAPVYGSNGELRAVLDISQLSSPLPKASQHLALQLVQAYAHHIENATFLRQHRHDWVLRLSGAPHFLDVNPDYLLALDASGRVSGHNRRAQCLLEPRLGGGAARGPGQPSRLLGQPFERLFEARLADLGRYQGHLAPQQRAVRVAGGPPLLYLLAWPPHHRVQVRPVSSPPAQAATGHAGVPAPLAALSGGDPQLNRQIERAARLVNAPVSLLITGETGSGKEYFAQALHRSGERQRGPFVAVNCAAIPEHLIESELFGYLPGSFSGAAPKGKRGLIQEADGGTLFLDEIGDMPKPLQARLLRVLSEHELLPVGATRPLRVDLRVIAATHCPLDSLVQEGRFRDDLYYRLNGAHFALPPLRDRHDLGWLIQRLLAAASAPEAPPLLSPPALALLQAHAWPGNLRELRNVLECARAVCDGGVIQPDDLPDDLRRAAALRIAVPGGTSAVAPEAPRPQPAAIARPPADADEPAAGQAGSAQLLQHRLIASHWNVSAVARELGCSRMTLYRRMKRWGIVSPRQA